jgi:hypothetical protein
MVVARTMRKVPANKASYEDLLDHHASAKAHASIGHQMQREQIDTTP